MPAQGWRKKICQKCGCAFWCSSASPVVCIECKSAPVAKVLLVLFALFLLFLCLFYFPDYVVVGLIIVLLFVALFVWNRTKTNGGDQEEFPVNLLDGEFWKTATLKDVKAAIKRSADLHDYDTNGCTPLHWAVAKSEKPEVIDLLLEYMDVGVCTKNGWTPLHVAAANNETPEVIALLLDKGANIEARDEDGWAPLHAAVENSPRAVMLLLDKGANIEASGKNGWTPLRMAMKSENSRHEKSSILGIPFEAERKIPEIVTLLLNNGSNMEARDKDGNTLLHDMVISGKQEMVALLLNKGADIKARNKNGRTPLHSAISYGKPELLALMLSRGVNIESCGEYKKTPHLHEYPQENFDSVLRIMLFEARKEAQQFCRITPQRLHSRVVRGAQVDRMLMAYEAMGKLWKKQGSHEDRIIDTATDSHVTIEIEFDTGLTEEDKMKMQKLREMQRGYKDKMSHTTPSGNVTTKFDRSLAEYKKQNLEELLDDDIPF